LRNFAVAGIYCRVSGLIAGAIADVDIARTQVSQVNLLETVLAKSIFQTLAIGVSHVEIERMPQCGTDKGCASAPFCDARIKVADRTAKHLLNCPS
jgi:hypothetical protein